MGVGNLAASPNANGVGPNGNNGKPNKKNQVIVSAADTRTFSDALARRVLLPRALSQSLSVTDSIARSLLLPRGLTQSVSFSEQLARLLHLNRGPVDTEVFSENFIVASGRTLQDTVNFSDSIARSVVLNRGSIDTQVFAEGLNNPPHGLVRVIIDGENFSESLQFNLYPAARSLQDNFVFSEDPDPEITVIRLVADSIPTTDTLRGFAQVVRQLLDEFILAELPVKISLLTQNLIDSFSFSEQLVSNVIVNPPNYTTVQFADALGTPRDPATVAVDLLRLENENFAVTDSIASNVVLVSRSVIDSFSFSDTVVGFIENVPPGVLGRAVISFTQGGGSVKISTGGGSITVNKGSGKVTKTGGPGSANPITGSGEVN